MSTDRVNQCLSQERLLPFLPMLYVAWSDGDLSDTEIDRTRAHLESLERLDPDCTRTLATWLDPSDPPAPSEMASLLAVIREGARQLQAPERLTLVELGLELVRGSDLGDHIGDDERWALEELIEALGLTGTEASQQLLASLRPRAEVAPPPAPPVAPSFSAAEMTETLERPHARLRRRVKRLLARPDLASRPGESSESHRQRVLEGCRLLAREGLGALSYPEAYGGANDPGLFVAAFETLAHGDLSLLVKFGVQFGLFGGAVALLGTARHHDLYLRDIGTLALPGCFAMTETGHGSNVRDLETTAVFDPGSDEFVITTPHDGACKDYIGNAALHGRMAVVFAQLEVAGEAHGVHALLVPIRGETGQPSSGVRIEDCGEKLGLNGVDNGRLWFDNVRVPRESLLNRFADVDSQGEYRSSIPSASKRFFTTIGTLVGGRVSIALAALSVSKTALTISVLYGSQRRQFGPAGEPETLLLDYPTHQLRLLPRLAATYALHFALRHLTEQYVALADDDTREVEARAAGLKAWATHFATETVQESREACGAQGYLAVNRLGDLKADSDVFSTFEGDNTVLWQLLAKALLTGFHRQFQDMGLLGLVRHLAGEATTAVSELNPIITRRTEAEHLRNPEFHLAAMRWREAHMLAKVARRLKRRIEAGLDAQRAFTECQDHLIEAAHAHVERVILELFQAAIARQQSEEIRTILARLATLFALERLEADRGWFQEHGYLEPAKSKAIRAQVRALCSELRPDAPALVKAFDIPSNLLAAAIAHPS